MVELHQAYRNSMPALGIDKDITRFELIIHEDGGMTQTDFAHDEADDHLQKPSRVLYPNHSPSSILKGFLIIVTCHQKPILLLTESLQSGSTFIPSPLGGKGEPAGRQGWGDYLKIVTP